jgi:phage baseplate assembly protein W
MTIGSLTSINDNQYLGRVSRSFKDLSFNMTLNPITNDIVTLTNEEAIKQSVKNLVLTRLGERQFNAFLGTNVEAYLFELGSVILANNLIDEIEKTLNQYEPRIRISKLEVDIAEDSNNMEVFLEYLIIGLPPEVQSLSFILVRES